MKIYNWIDSFFDSKEKRKIVLFLFVLVYWLWQNVWQSMFYYELYKIVDYASLFSFLEKMNQFDYSMIVRILYQVIMSSTMPVFQIVLRAFQQLDLIDIFVLFMSFLLYKSSYEKGKWRCVLLLCMCLLIFDLLLISLGFLQGSLSGVITILHILSIGSMGFELFIIGCILIALVKVLSQYVLFNQESK